MFKPASRPRLKKLLAAFALAFASTTALASGGEAERKGRPLPFEPSEQLIYEGDFSRLFLRGIKIAEFRFNAAPVAKLPADKPGAAAGSANSDARVSPAQLSLTGDVTSEGWFHKLFNIDFHFRMESIVERDTLAVVKSTKLDAQGKRVRTSEAVFDRAGQTDFVDGNRPNDSQRPPRRADAPLEARSTTSFRPFTSTHAAP
jgi:hypothetical protein